MRLSSMYLWTAPRIIFQPATWSSRNLERVLTMSNGSEESQHSEGGIALQEAKPKLKKPPLYKVIMLNDDYTPMEFVVHVLEQYFDKRSEEAVRIMLHVHQKGVGMCGVYTYEVAETKVSQVMDLARQHQHPLQCTIEKDGDDDQ